MNMTMRKLLAILATLAIVCTVLPLGSLFSAVAAINLVHNGGFTDDLSGWSYKSGIAEIVSDSHGSDNKALSLTNPSLYEEAAAQTVTVVPGNDYKITWWSKRIEGTGSFNLYVMNADGYANLKTVDGQNWMNETSGKWVKNEYVVNSGTASSAIIKFSTEGNNPGTIYLDDIVMTKVGGNNPDVPAPSGNNLFANGDFETGDSTGWETWQNTVISGDAAKDGSHGAHLQGAGSYGGLLNQTVTVEAGKEYKLSFWINVNKVGVNLQVMNGAGAVIAGAGGWYDANKKDYLVSYTFTATDNAVFVNFCGAGTGAAEDAYVDNFSLVCLSGGETPDTPDTPAPSGNNLLANGDFETGALSGWDNLWDNCTVDFVTGRDSSYAMQVKGNLYNMVRQKVTVEANTDYVLTAWSKDAANVSLLVKDGNDSVNIAQQVAASGSSWAKTELKFNSGSYTSVFVSIMANDNNASIIVDDVVLVKAGGSTDEPDVPVEPSDSGFVNGTFETGDLTGWVPAQQTTISADAAHSGSYGANLKGNGSYGGLLDQTFAVEKGKDYTLSFWHKANSGGANFVVKSNGNPIASYYGSAASWSQYSLEFTADGEELFLNICGSGTNVAEDIYVDDFVLAVKGETPDEPSEPDEPEAPVVPEGYILYEHFENGFGSMQSSCKIAVVKDNTSVLMFNVDTDWGNVYAGLKLEAETDYTISFKAKAKSNSNIWIKLNDNWGPDVASADVSIGTEWKEYTVTLNSHACTSPYLLLQYSGEAKDGAVIWFDDIAVYEAGTNPTPPDVPVNPDTPDEPVEPDEPDEPDEPVIPDGPVHGEFVNGDFENGSEGWALGDAASIVDDAHDGAGALRLENPSPWSEAAIQYMDVQPNTDYVIKLWTKRLEGSKTFNLAIMDPNNNFKNIKVTEGQAWFQGGTAEWQQHIIVINTDVATALALKWTAQDADAGILLVDDMSIAVKGEDPKPELGTILNGDFESGSDGWKLGEGASITDDVLAGTGALKLDNISAWSEAALQTIPVEAETDYIIKMWIKFDSGSGPFNLAIMDPDNNFKNLKLAEGSQNWFRKSEIGADWKQLTIEFNTGSAVNATLKWTSEANGAGALLIDNMEMYKKGEEPEEPDEPILPPTVSLSLDTMGVLNNRPINEAANLIVNGSFEKAEGGQWQDILGDTLIVVDDETTLFGNKSLYFNTSGVEENNKLIFWMDVVPNTDYVFSTWIKGAFIADDNRYNATIGVVDEAGKFLVYDNPEFPFSNKERQIVPPCWDNEWHLRSVSFNSGRGTKVGIALAGNLSKLWVDDIALFTAENGIKYADPRQTGLVQVETLDSDQGSCADVNSLIPVPNMDDTESYEFWTGAEGWSNGFVSFYENEYEYGTSLKYTGGENSFLLHTIKWLEVQPNTKYTFSVDMRIVTHGWGKLALLDGKKRDCERFLTIDFDKHSYGADWFNVTVEFNTGAFDRIGIAIVDGGGEALIDNMRLFESIYRTEDIVDDYIKPPYSFEDPEEPEEPTGCQHEYDNDMDGDCNICGAVRWVVCPNTSIIVGGVEGSTELPTGVELLVDEWNVNDFSVDLSPIGVENAELLQFFDIYLMLNGEYIQPGGKVAVTIPAPANSDRFAQLQVVYFDYDGNAFACDTTINEDGSLTFFAEHFSYYGIVGVPVTDVPADPEDPADPADPEDSVDPESPDTGDSSVAVVVALVILMTFGVAAFVLKNKKRA